ncbi:MAG: gamma carbonic anhydrase family protein [Alphaproteobacteria bacterium]|nr:gamma carbonic anhydrase family protein [Alphaproteobacteria bacterium]MBL6954425.1 gamma carbonic anhydrase family protein [Alphaproteobacteria bacterium]
MRKFGPLVQLDNPAFVHDTAEIYGKVSIAEGASVWPRVVMRAEMYEIVVGPYTNLQDFVMLHVGDRQGTFIGAHCSITHHATVHGCTIGDNCLIGINATVMDSAVIGENTIVAGHSIVTAGSQIPANSIVAGVPGAVVKSRDNFIANRLNAFIYHYNALAYARGEHRAWDSPAFEQAKAAEHANLEAELAALEKL